MSKFPKGFLWGASTSAYQVEGASNTHGKKPSQQDIINQHNYEKYGFATAEIASDHYHNYKEDVQLMKEMNFSAYRFSIGWSRVFPDGVGEVNEEGIQFYRNLIDELLAAGIEPIVTLYHYDLPWALVEKYDGWLNRQVVADFEYFASYVIEEFKDKVKYWTTINEQSVIVQYWTKKCFIRDEHIGNDQLRFQINHHMNLAHAIGCKLVHEKVKGGQVGAALGYSPVYPASSKPADVMAAQNAHDLRNSLYLDVYFKGEYNKAAMIYLENNGMAPIIEDGDIELFKEGYSDFLALNYYSSDCAMASDGTEQRQFGGVNLTGVKGEISGFETQPGFYKLCKNEFLDTTDWDWTIDPMGLEYILRDIYTRYNKPLMITENGMGAFDEFTEDKKIHDDYRIDYIGKHIDAIGNAIEYGVPVIAYCPWSAIDLVSTSNGVKKRYGFIYVDRTDDDPKQCKRYKKDSYYWYQELIANNGPKTN